MTREEQRQLGVLVMGAASLNKKEQSTHPATVHASEVLMEHLALQGVDTYKDYTAEQRRRMAKAGQAMPDGSFPIANCADAENAIHAVGRAKNPDAAKSFIRRRVRALGCSGSIFENWK
jgi:hypothetical protein